MRKQGVSARLANGAIEQRGELLSLRVGKIKTLSRHDLLPLEKRAAAWRALAPQAKRRGRGRPSAARPKGATAATLPDQAARGKTPI